MLGVKEERAERPSWTWPATHGISILAMEEMCLRHPNGDTIKDLVVRVTHEFEENGFGVSVITDGLTIIGRKPGA